MQRYYNYDAKRSNKNSDHIKQLRKMHFDSKSRFCPHKLKIKKIRAEYVFNGLHPYWMRSDGWMVALLWWSFFSYYVTGMSFLASMLVLYISSKNIGGQDEYIIYSIVAATFTIINFAVKPNKRSIAYRRAWARLDNEIFSFTNNHFSVIYSTHEHSDKCYYKLAEAVRLGELDIERGDD